MGEDFCTENYQKRYCNVSITKSIGALLKKEHDLAWPPGKLEIPGPPQACGLHLAKQALKQRRTLAQCGNRVHLTPDTGQTGSNWKMTQGVVTSFLSRVAVRCEVNPANLTDWSFQICRAEGWRHVQVRETSHSPFLSSLTLSTESLFKWNARGRVDLSYISFFTLGPPSSFSLTNLLS